MVMMWQESSQPFHAPERGRTIGPAMSPTPSVDGDENDHEHDPNTQPESPKSHKKKRKSIDAAASQAVAEGLGNGKSSRKKKMKKKKKKSRNEDENGIDEVIEGTQYMAEDVATQETSPREKPSKKRSKKRSKNATNVAGSSQDNVPYGDVSRIEDTFMEDPPQEDAGPGSPPSAQQPDLKREPIFISEQRLANDTVMPSSYLSPKRRRSSAQSHESIRKRRKREPATNEEPVSVFAGFAAVEHRMEPVVEHHADAEDLATQSEERVVHKREASESSAQESIPAFQPNRESDDTEHIEDLHPSQVKGEPASESEDDNESPSVSRQSRLERSRSQSLRPDTTRFDLAEQDIPSSPPVARPNETEFEAAVGNHDLPTVAEQNNGMDVDQEADGENVEIVEPSKKIKKKRDKRARSGEVDVSDRVPQDQLDEMAVDEVTNAASRKKQGKKAKNQKRRRSQSGEAEPEPENKEAEFMATWMSRPPNSKSPADHKDVQNDGVLEKDNVGNSTATAARSKKKPKKKRSLQNGISLSQMEEMDSAGEGPSQLATQSKSKIKNTMRGGSHEPGDTQNEPELDELKGESQSRSQSQSQAQPQVKPKKAKKKRRSPNDASEDEMDSILANPPKNSKSATGTPKAKRKLEKQKSVAKDSYASGPWSQEELTALGKVVDEFRDDNDLTQYQINELIHAVPSKTGDLNQDLWSKTVVQIPHRNKKQIMERARRLYNNFVARGTWTDEQKEELHEMFETHGTKWKKISDIIKRDQGDIRHYHTNYYLCRDSQAKSTWSEEEGTRLREVVGQAIDKIRFMRENDNNYKGRPRAKGSDDEGLIDWQQISEAMGFTRSRQQCKWKWKDMREKGLIAGEYQPQPTPKPKPEEHQDGISQDLAAAREDLHAMSAEEMLIFVQAIQDGGFRNDGHIKWSALVDDQFRRKWKRPTLRILWSRLRQTVPGYEDNDVQANARYLLNAYNIRQQIPVVRDDQVDALEEERLIAHKRGEKVWKKPADTPGAKSQRRRRSSSVSSRSSSATRVSGEILKIDNSDEDEPPQPSQKHIRSGSVDLGVDEDQPEVSVNIPKHLAGSVKSAEYVYDSSD